MMSYLFDHMSFTAKLINAYQGGAYSIDYKTPNRRVFLERMVEVYRAILFGWLKIVQAKNLGFRNVFFGVGRVKIFKMASDWNSYRLFRHGFYR